MINTFAFTCFSTLTKQCKTTKSSRFSQRLNMNSNRGKAEADWLDRQFIRMRTTGLSDAFVTVGNLAFIAGVGWRTSIRGNIDARKGKMGKDLL